MYKHPLVAVYVSSAVSLPLFAATESHRIALLCNNKEVTLYTLEVVYTCTFADGHFTRDMTSFVLSSLLRRVAVRRIPNTTSARCLYLRTLGRSSHRLRRRYVRGGRQSQLAAAFPDGHSKRALILYPSPPSCKQYWKVKQNHWSTILFFKKGKFYEVYERDAGTRVDRHMDVGRKKRETADSV